MGWKKERGVRGAAVTAVMLAILSSGAALAEEDPAYSFDWLDPDKKIYVLQNRRYEKQGHLLLSAMGGVGISETYRSVLNFDPRAAYYFTEALGIEVFYQMSFFRENSTFEALGNAVGSNPVMPSVREIRGKLGALAHWSPWYAKINVFNQILYFDWYFTAGAGQIQTKLDTRDRFTDAPSLVDESFVAFYAGTGHQFHLSKNFIIRLDFMGTFYSAPLYGQSGPSTLFMNFDFNAGVGLKL